MSNEMIDEVYCIECKSFILIKNLVNDYTKQKGFANCTEPLNRCPRCNKSKFKIYKEK
jgi:hypothetical protein